MSSFLKRIDAHLNSANANLSKKLEEKNNIIKNLSFQLSNHELSFKEIKTELKEVSFTTHQ